MKFFTGHLARAGACALLFAASPAGAQTAANGPYYATPSWDQTLPAATRFIVLANFNNEAVLDRETGLVWWRSPQAERDSFRGAYPTCFGAITGGRSGWRLPTLVEFFTLLDFHAPTIPRFPAGHPFTGFSSIDTTFWTTTVSPNGGDQYRYVVGTGYTYGVRSDLTGRESVLCVRGGGDPGPAPR